MKCITFKDVNSKLKPPLNNPRTIGNKVIGENNPGSSSIPDSLSDIYFEDGRYADAKILLNRSITMKEQTLGKDNVNLWYEWVRLARIYEAESQYAKAVSLYKDSLRMIETNLGSEFPLEYDVLNYLTKAYTEWGHIGEALPLVNRLLAKKKIAPSVGFQTVLSAQKADLTTDKQAFATTFVIRQFVSAPASVAVGNLSQRLAAGSSPLADLIRRDQDLAMESARLDKNLVDASSKPVEQRYAPGEEEIRGRLAGIAAERQTLQSTLAKDFPDYIALAQPEPLTASETQALLDDDEAVVAFYEGIEKSYAWTLTKEEGFWTEIPTNAKQLNEQVQQLRSSLTFNADAPFDATLAYRIYQETFGPIADKIADKKRLSVIANGALTSIPLGMLVTKDPTGKSLKDTDWLIKSFAVTVEPSISSIKTMRAKEKITPAPKPMIAFADPVFSQKARNQTHRRTLRSGACRNFTRARRLTSGRLATHCRNCRARARR